MRDRRSNFPPFVRLSTIYVESSINVYFSEAVIAGSVKPCVTIVLDILFKHALWTGALDLDFVLEWLCHDFMSSIIHVESYIIHFESSIKVYFSEAVIAVSVQSHKVIILDKLLKHALWNSVLDLDFVLRCCHDFRSRLALFTSSLALQCISLKRW